MKLAEMWGQQIIIDNRPGAGGIIGSDFVAKSPPDGYTLYLGSGSAFSQGPGVRNDLPYDPLKDMTLVGLVGAGVLAASGYGLYTIGMQRGMGMATSSAPSAGAAATGSVAPGAVPQSVAEGEDATRRHISAGRKFVSHSRGHCFQVARKVGRSPKAASSRSCPARRLRRWRRSDTTSATSWPRRCRSCSRAPR